MLNTPQLMTTQQAADLLGLKPQTLCVWRCQHRVRTLRFLRLGRAIRYRASDVEHFLEANTHGDGDGPPPTQVA